MTNFASPIDSVFGNEFLRRFLLHVLPPAFVRIRSFGFLANRRRATLLPSARKLSEDSRFAGIHAY
jgi:hypothetical protein